ncbi:hypothetical protein ABE504_00555 [Paenibacillus oryzisoli]|uniref:hypothetical protein n=1 Tax=Paenibacillus oryzisoli TaxID=1850517 RepID=UPI003D2E321E
MWTYRGSPSGLLVFFGRKRRKQLTIFNVELIRFLLGGISYESSADVKTREYSGSFRGATLGTRHGSNDYRSNQFRSTQTKGRQTNQ